MIPVTKRVNEAVKRHIPLIKFPDRRALKVNAQPAGLSNQQLSSAGTPSPPTPSATTHAVRSYRELPARYRRKPLDQVEIDYIQRGGPE